MSNVCGAISVFSISAFRVRRMRNWRLLNYPVGEDAWVLQVNGRKSRSLYTDSTAIVPRLVHIPSENSGRSISFHLCCIWCNRLSGCSPLACRTYAAKHPGRCATEPLVLDRFARHCGLNSPLIDRPPNADTIQEYMLKTRSIKLELTRRSLWWPGAWKCAVYAKHTYEYTG